MWDAQVRRQSSWIWQGILAGKNVFKDGVRMNIGDGHSTLIWHDPWVLGIANFHVVRPLHCLLHINLVNQIGIYWNHHLVHLARAILSILVTSVDSSDSLVCHFEQNEQYNVKSGYKYLI